MKEFSLIFLHDVKIDWWLIDVKLTTWYAVTASRVNFLLSVTIFHLDPLHLCWFLAVGPFNTWLISSWEENKCCYKLSKCTKWQLFHSKLSKLSFRVIIVVILSVAQLVTTIIFFSAWDKSRFKWYNSWNSTEKMWT